MIKHTDTDLYSEMMQVNSATCFCIDCIAENYQRNGVPMVSQTFPDGAMLYVNAKRYSELMGQGLINLT